MPGAVPGSDWTAWTPVKMSPARSAVPRAFSTTPSPGGVWFPENVVASMIVVPPPVWIPDAPEVVMSPEIVESLMVAVPVLLKMAAPAAGPLLLMVTHSMKVEFSTVSVPLL